MARTRAAGYLSAVLPQPDASDIPAAGPKLPGAPGHLQIQPCAGRDLRGTDPGEDLTPSSPSPEAPTTRPSIWTPSSASYKPPGRGRQGGRASRIHAGRLVRSARLGSPRSFGTAAIPEQTR